VLVVPHGAVPNRGLVHEASVIFSEHDVTGVAAERCFSLNSFDAVLPRQLGTARPSSIPSERQLQAA